MEELIQHAAKTAPLSTRDVTAPIPEGHTQVDLFKNREIRKVCHNDEWWYSVADVVRAIMQSDDEGAWRKVKSRLKQEGSQVVADCDELKMPGKNGKMYPTDCANAETIFRIIQSIPTPHAEPFKKWLAKTAYERILEIQNPEIAVNRAIMTWRIQGRDEPWIRNRLQTVVSRNLLTAEWQKRGVKEGIEYALLTDTISLGTFGKTTGDHYDYKSLDKKRHNLRDHMSGLELVLTMLGEEATKEFAVQTDAQGFRGNREAAKSGGAVAGQARKSIEQQTRKPVLSRDNFLGEKPQKLLPN